MQSLRDAIIVTSCGAEALPFISAFGVLPASLIFFMYYERLVRPAASLHLLTLCNHPHCIMLLITVICSPSGITDCDRHMLLSKHIQLKCQNASENN
jgi:ATP/ADP translocase